MTDEQANNITREQAIRILHPDTSIEAIDDYEEAGNYEHAYDTACLMAVDALRGPHPDPDTGLVPCGCGGKAVFDSAYGDDEVESSYTAEVYCELCEIRTPIFRENADVKAAWNRAMGRQEMSEGDQVCGHCRRQHEY